MVPCNSYTIRSIDFSNCTFFLLALVLVFVIFFFKPDVFPMAKSTSTATDQSRKGVKVSLTNLHFTLTCNQAKRATFLTIVVVEFWFTTASIVYFYTLHDYYCEFYFNLHSVISISMGFSVAHFPLCLTYSQEDQCSSSKMARPTS